MTPFFVYGSLQDVDVLAALLGEHSLNCEPADLAGHRCFYVQNGSYPNIQKDPHSKTRGHLLYGLTEEQLPILDAFEEGYDRRLATVSKNGESVEAFVYFGSEKVDPQRPFDFQKWLQTHKSEFLSCQARWQFTNEWKPKPHCRLCRSPSSEVFQCCEEKVKKGSSLSRHYWKCENCDYVFLDDSQLPSPAEERAVYDLHENSPEDAAYVAFLSQLVDPLKKHLKASLSDKEKLHGLDFGCGPGPTIAAMFADEFWKTRITVQNYDPIFFPKPTPWEQSFDFIASTEVFEHLHHPADTIEKLWNILKPGGLLAVMSSLRREEVDFASWHYRRDPTHVGFFSEQTVHWLEEQFNAELLHISRNTFLLQKY